MVINVPAHGTKIYRAKAEKRLERKVYEAETAYLSKYQELQWYYDLCTAIYLPNPAASGGYAACYVGYRPGNDIQWQNVHVNKAGRRIGVFAANGKDGSKPQTLKVNIDLQEGNNVIRLWNDGVWLPDIDKMELD